MANHQFKAILIKIRFHERVCNITPKLLIMLYFVYNIIWLLLVIMTYIYIFLINFLYDFFWTKICERKIIKKEWVKGLGFKDGNGNERFSG